MTTQEMVERKVPSWSEILHKAVNDPGTMSAAFSRFWEYSFGNQLLALAQCRERGIEPGPIATFNRWKELDRHVKKGERALVLCMPITGKFEKKNPDTGETETVPHTYFTYKPRWFVLGQTDGKDYTPPPVPDWDMERALKGLGIERMPFTLTDGNTQGYAEGNKVALNPLADAATLFHEIAHIVLGHTKDKGTLSESDRTPRNIRELEAEAVSLLVTETFGLSGAEESRGYIQHWYKGHTIPNDSAARIMTAADKIIKAGIPKGGKG